MVQYMHMHSNLNKATADIRRQVKWYQWFNECTVESYVIALRLRFWIAVAATAAAKQQTEVKSTIHLIVGCHFSGLFYARHVFIHIFLYLCTCMSIEYVIRRLIILSHDTIIIIMTKKNLTYISLLLEVVRDCS